MRSSSIRPEEEELRKKLEEMQEVIRGGGGRMRAKLGELWAVLGAVKAREGGKTGSTRGGEWKVVDEEGLTRIIQVCIEPCHFIHVSARTDFSRPASRPSAFNQNSAERSTRSWDYHGSSSARSQ